MLWHPIGRDVKFLFGLGAVVGLERQLKQVLAAHPHVHRKLGADQCALTRLNHRRTDGGGRRSTSFQQFGRDARL